VLLRLSDKGAANFYRLLINLVRTPKGMGFINNRSKQLLLQRARSISHQLLGNEHDCRGQGVAGRLQTFLLRSFKTSWKVWGLGN
jgi:hypothetical protein